MIWAKSMRKDVFCLEGDWNTDLTLKGGIKHTLDFMSMNLGIDVIHRHCATEESFNYLIQEYTLPKYKDYSILYLAFHGFPNQIQVGETNVELEDIAELCKGQLRNKIVYFGSCLTLNIDKRRINTFLKETKALAVCGYKESIDFIPSTVLDILVMETLQRHKDMRKVETFLNENYSQLMNKLKFRMVY